MLMNDNVQPKEVANTCSHEDILSASKVIGYLLYKNQIDNNKSDYVYEMLKTVGLEEYHSQIMGGLQELQAMGSCVTKGILCLHNITYRVLHRAMAYLVYKYK